MGIFDTLINMFKNAQRMREERLEKEEREMWERYQERWKKKQTYIHDNFFGEMYVIKADEYQGKSYGCAVDILKKGDVEVVFENNQVGASDKQVEFYKTIIENFDELEERMHKKLLSKLSISTEQFYSQAELFKIIVYDLSNDKRKWFASYQTLSFDLHYIGFGFDNFEVNEVVLITNSGKEL